MRKAIALLLVIAMTAAISIGGTLAYLTDTDEDVNVMTVGQVKIDQLEYERVDTETKDDDAKVQEFHDNKPLYPAVTKDGFDYKPGDTYVDWEQIGKGGYTSDIWDPTKINNEVDKMVFVKNKGDWDAYVRTVFAFEAGNYATLTDYLKDVHLNLNDTDWTWKWVETPITIGEGSYFVATATYNEVLKPGALTEISLSQIALDSSVTNADVAGFGDTYQVLVQSQAVQVAGFENADSALTAAFGEVPPSPFPNDKPNKGVDVRTALHYLNGNSAGTKITANVTDVVFGLNKDHTAITDKYEGVLVDEEQDVPVYAYYVEDSGKYTVYFLANDEVFLPANSKALFKNMTALETVDTGNLNTSRVETMYELFRFCRKLESIDVSEWNVSNVTDMFSVFDECKVLKEIDVSNWDTGKVQSISYMFYQCIALEYLDVSEWDVSNVVNTRSAFYYCDKLEEIEGVENWDTSNVENMSYTFSGCNQLTELNIGGWDVGNVTTFEGLFCSRYSNQGDMKVVLDLSEWDVSSATNMKWMFYGCGELTKMDMSKWDMSNVTTTYHMFADCFKMVDYNFSGWNTPKLVDTNGMFNSNKALKSVNLSDWDTQNVESFAQLFDGCVSLEEIIGLDKWHTDSMLKMGEMFNGCGSLKILDLSSFDTSKLIQTDRAFYNCSGLTTIYVGDGWTVSNVTTDVNMFTGCSSIVGGNGTTYQGSDLKYACVDSSDTPGYLTYKATP